MAVYCLVTEADRSKQLQSYCTESNPQSLTHKTDALLIAPPYMYNINNITTVYENNELLTNVRTWRRLCATKSSKTVSRRPNGSRIPDRDSCTFVSVPTAQTRTVTRLFCRHLL